MVANLSAQQSSIDYSALIKNDQVHGRLYYDEDIFQEELEKIWYKQWIYIGHDSEVANIGDYVTTFIGKQPIIIVRDSNHQVQVYLNRCRHRGNTICEKFKGNTGGFVCAYHGWTFNLEGELKALPLAEGFGDNFNMADYSLVKVPRVGNHRGFLFASMAEEGKSFAEHLGLARDNIDRFCDTSPSGKIAVSAGVWKMKIKANWKMWMENSVDLYHAISTHASNAYMAQMIGQKDPTVTTKMPTSIGQFNKVVLRNLGNGHTEADMRPLRRATGMNYTGDWTDGVPEAAQKAFVDQMEAFHGKQKADDIAIDGPPHTVMFPNLFFMLQDIRWAVPVSVDETWLYYAPTMLVDAPDEINTMRLRRDEGAYGPAGFQLSDDLEVWARNYRGIATRKEEWIMMGRGADMPTVPDSDGVPTQDDYSELTIRSQWQHYLKVMQGD